MASRRASTSSESRRASIVIPTLNEAKNLSVLLPQLRASPVGRKAELIIVDGHSGDGTARVAKRHGARVIYDSVGKGSAIIAGMRAARGDVIIIMDADLSHATEELDELVARIRSGCDVCMGSRFMPGGGSGDITLLRFLGNKFFIALVNLIWGTRYTDLCYGYRSFSRSAARLMRLTSTGFGIETEISIKCAKMGLRTIEIPSYEKPRLHGESNLSTFGDGWIVLKTIVSEALSR